METLNSEVWKDIPGYEGLYQASSWGRVKSLNRKVINPKGKGFFMILEGKVLKFVKNPNGYLQLWLSKDGKRKLFLAHRLIALTFLPKEEGFDQVNHIDEDKENNRVENLEWCTAEYNKRYSVSKKIGQYDYEGNLIKAWDFVGDAEKETGINRASINQNINNKRKTAGGFIWRYLDENN